MTTRASTPGIKTTEFALTVVAVAVGALLSSGLLPAGGVAVKIVGLVVSTLATLGYTASRTCVKMSENSK